MSDESEGLRQADPDDATSLDFAQLRLAALDRLCRNLIRVLGDGCHLDVPAKWVSA